MNYRNLIDGMARFGSNERDICLQGLGVPPERINDCVILAPWWEPRIFPSLGNAQYLSQSEFSAIKVWDITNGDLKLTYIKTGIGAPILMDVILALGVTECKNIIFIGSVGSLDEAIGIGDIVIPELSICGDGASRYISGASLANSDVFGKKVYPSAELFDLLLKQTQDICESRNVGYHIGRAFSIDTIFAQFAHIDEIITMGCNVIEMETAAAFRAAEIAGIKIAALFSVSDNTIAHKSLISGRSESELEYRVYTRKTVFPEIILGVMRQVKA